MGWVSADVDYSSKLVGYLLMAIRNSTQFAIRHKSTDVDGTNDGGYGPLYQVGWVGLFLEDFLLTNQLYGRRSSAIS